MAPKLYAEEGPLKGLTLNLKDQESWTIGRDPDACDLVVEDPAVSRSHLTLRKTEEGFFVDNLSKTNPALINGKEIEETSMLREGDLLTVGSENFRFHEVEKPEVVEEEDQDEDLDDAEDEDQDEGLNDNEEEEETPSRDSIFEHKDHSDKSPDLAEINFDVTEMGRWLLKVITGPNNGAEFAMETGNVYMIGTDPNTCDVVFNDNSVSRQHARISISDEGSVTIEDLSSRNGTLIDGEKLEGKEALEPNMLVSLGTTSFVIFDREGEMQTIISPLLPQIVRSLQEKKEDEELTKEEKEEEVKEAAHESKRTMGAFILIAIVTGLFVIVGIGLTTLFTGKAIEESTAVNYDEVLDKTLAAYPEVKYQYNRSTGRLLLIGHVLTPSDATKLINSLRELPFVNQIDDQNVVIDEYLWREINQVLARDPKWRGIAIHAPKPGQFVISGYLQSREEGERLSDYLNANFPFLDLLENRVVVEENVVRQVNSRLEGLGFDKVLAQMTNGELTLAGTIPRNNKEKLDNLITELKKIPGLRSVRSYVKEQSPQEAVVNISDRYEVTGVTRKGNVNTNVVINGRVLTVGDSLDGRVITSIGESSIFLKEGDVIYRIDYNG